MQYCLDALSENTNIEGEEVLHPHNYSEHCKQTVRGLKKGRLEVEENGETA